MSGALALMLGLAAVAANDAAAATDECPALLIYKVSGLSAHDAALAQKYAHCVRIPWLTPAPNALAERVAQCKSKLPKTVSGRVADAVAWVDKMTVNFKDCETRLAIEKR